MVPNALPLKVLHTAPEWKRNEDGEVVAVSGSPIQNDPTYRKSSHVALPRPSSARRCVPLSVRDPNAERKIDECTMEKRTNDGRDLLQIQPSKKTLSGVTGKVRSAPAFDIYDETEKTTLKSTSPQTSSIKMEDIICKAGALSLLDRRPEIEPPGATLSSPRTRDCDLAVLFQMLERLDTVLNVAETRKNSYIGPSPRATTRGGPKTWVTRYVDYTSKYGLGFLLNNGCSGVYFNDSTKAVLEAEGKCFEYFERRKVENKETGSQQNEPICEMHTLNAYPESLEKKVTLLKHFRNYLIEQQKKANDDDLNTVFESGNAAFEEKSLIFIKKWMRTKHAILFRLSNQTVQIVFYDQTEILFTPDERFVTHVDRQRNRATYYLNDELAGTNPELAKRMKYAKEILQQLLAGQRGRSGP